MTTLVSTINMVVMETSNLGGFISTIDPTILGQWTTLLAAIAGIGWGFIEKRKSNKQTSQIIQKNTYEQLQDENKLLIIKAQKLRKSEDKWFLARRIILELPNGTEVIKKIEDSADQISSDE